MRVISGKARGTSLFSLEGSHTRPTTDRVKEAMFSIINFYLYDALALDLFAGSGALGIEALSRGAKKCIFVENSHAAADVVRKNLEKTGLLDSSELKICDFKDYLDFAKEGFDVILLDPPYNKKLCDEALEIIYQKNLLNDEGIIVCETEFEEVVSTRFIKKKDYKYGKIKLSVYTKGD